MEITLAGAVVHLILFFSILFLYCVVDIGRIKYCVLEGQPQSYKKRKAPEQTEDDNEEAMLVEVDLISTPVDISEKENKQHVETVEIDQISTPVDISQIITEILQTGFDLWEQKTGKKGMTHREMREMFG
jgi:hypothetical protein